MSPAAPFQSLSVLGGGAWGAALAHLSAQNGVETLLWAREPEVASSIARTGENTLFLPGVRLHEGLRATADLESAARADAFLLAVPAQHCRAVLTALRPHAAADAPIAICAKGIEQKTGLLLTEVLADIWLSARPAVLSGPSFARDVALGLPTAVTIACAEAGLGERFGASVGARHFRPYFSDDLIGAELGGAVKNVLAVAAGVVEGRGLGESARAAVIARGFAEFQRLGVALGARPETMAGLSGLGDLILTATSRASRNMSLGYDLGKGRPLADILAERRSVAEGVATAPAVVARARKAGVETPICAAVADLVAGARGLDEIIESLLARPLKAEWV